MGRKRKSKSNAGRNPLAAQSRQPNLLGTTSTSRQLASGTNLSGSTVYTEAPTAGFTLDQRRARFALNKVQFAAQQSYASGYRSYVRRLPSVVVSNGLGQAIALEMAQSSRGGSIGAGHQMLLEHVVTWLRDAEGWGKASPYFEGSGSSNDSINSMALIKAIVSGSCADLTRAQVEIMAFLKWLKIFAEALIDPQAAGDQSDDPEMEVAR